MQERSEIVHRPRPGPCRVPWGEVVLIYESLETSGDRTKRSGMSGRSRCVWGRATQGTVAAGVSVEGDRLERVFITTRSGARWREVEEKECERANRGARSMSGQSAWSRGEGHPSLKEGHKHQGVWSDEGGVS